MKDNIAVVFDACVLFQASLKDLLIELATSAETARRDKSHSYKTLASLVNRCAYDKMAVFAGAVGADDNQPVFSVSTGRLFMFWIQWHPLGIIYMLHGHCIRHLRVLRILSIYR